MYVILYKCDNMSLNQLYIQKFNFKKIILLVLLNYTIIFPN